MLRSLTCSSTYRISSEHTKWSVHLYVQFFECKSGVLNSSQLYILGKSAVKRYYANNNNSLCMFHLFSLIQEFMEAKQSCHQVVRTSGCTRYDNTKKLNRTAVTLASMATPWLHWHIISAIGLYLVSSKRHGRQTTRETRPLWVAFQFHQK